MRTQEIEIVIAALIDINVDRVGLEYIYSAIKKEQMGLLYTAEAYRLYSELLNKVVVKEGQINDT